MNVNKNIFQYIEVFKISAVYTVLMNLENLFMFVFCIGESNHQYLVDL